ncbi:unnamed protein product [Rotaria sordida]|uniref:Uncharacterized protein n=1 Tax=Rotaria sordida TaxID=392033 RepID=A0A814DXK5_9BILA|nr:unnamed protein product [Rotaria sordida]CAF3616178.1 unnamed protein product [Rotaria sordida]
MILNDPQHIFKRHIGSARENFFRAKQLKTNNENLFQRQQQALPSPDVLRELWTELFKEQRKIHEPLDTKA